ncbi:MAG: FtsX-like permease family protein [Candidatus Hecatellaceae archaeon]
MGSPSRLLEAGLWLGLKRFKTTWVRVKPAILVLAVVTANFTLIMASLKAFTLTLPLASTLTIMAVAFAATMLHLVRLASPDIGLLKALGAERGTITFAILVELAILGLVSALAGLAAGIVTAVFLLGLVSVQFIVLPTLYLALVSVAAGALVGAVAAWKRLRQTVAEILANAG